MRLKLVIAILFPVSLFAADNPSDTVQQPVNTVQTPIQAKANNDTGQKIYDQHCAICHRDGLAGAPKFQNEADWKPRLEGKKIEDLLASSIKGINAMPAKGTCVECSDDDLKAAIEYMLPKS